MIQTKEDWRRQVKALTRRSMEIRLKLLDAEEAKDMHLQAALMREYLWVQREFQNLVVPAIELGIDVGSPTVA